MSRRKQVPRVSNQHRGSEVINGIFISPAEQLELAYRRNTVYRWGLADEDFTALSEPPAWPGSQLSAVVLDIALDTVQQTFEEAWHCAASVQRNSWRWDQIEADPDHLRLLPGITHKRGLCWRIVDLGANWEFGREGVCPADVCNPKTSPHSAVLWAASYFPEWVRSMDGKTVPYVWIPGYQLNIPTGRDKHWTIVPHLGWNWFHRAVELSCDEADNPLAYYWAVPILQEATEL